MLTQAFVHELEKQNTALESRLAVFTESQALRDERASLLAQLEEFEREASNAMPIAAASLAVVRLLCGAPGESVLSATAPDFRRASSTPKAT